MSKVREFLIIGFVIAVIISLAVGLGFSGVKNGGYNYVELEINPKIEFVTNSKDKVVSVYPINADAKLVITGEQFEGLNIKEAVKKYLELTTKLNYLDVERNDNVVKFTCVSGLTKALEVKLYRTINSYLTENQIMGVVVENTEDLQEFKEAKKLGVSNDKYSLVEAYMRLYPDSNSEEVKNLSEKKLIEKIKEAHENVKSEVLSYSEEELGNKNKQIELNSAKIENHKSKITNKTKSEFKEEYVKNKKQNEKKYETNFDEQSAIWKESKINGGVA